MCGYSFDFMVCYELSVKKTSVGLCIFCVVVTYDVALLRHVLVVVYVRYSLGNNSIGDEGAKYLGEGIKLNQTLTELRQVILFV